MIEGIPKEFYYFLGMILVAKFDTIMDFFKSRIKAEVRLNQIEGKLESLTIGIGKLEKTLETYQKDLNGYFEKIRDRQ